MTERRNRPGFATRAVHAGQKPDPLTGAVMTPIYLSSTFAMEKVGETKGFIYSRVANPTRTPYEACVADLEGGTRGVAFASGLAAASAVLELLDAGAHVVAMEDLYGGITRLLREVKARTMGLRVDFADLSVPGALDAALRPDTKLVWVETPTNPQLKLVDLAEIGKVCRARGIISVVDNTFATPRLQRPIEHGIDLVLHSATKYLNGHSDVVSGIVVVGDNAELAERLHFMQYALGGIPSPFDSFLVLRGLKTLHLRVDRSCENAAAIAAWLAKHPKVERVNYPGLVGHPQHALAKRQMAGFGGMVTFLPKGGLDAAKRLSERCELFHLAVSLGGVESLIELPALMTHRTVPAELRAKVGVVDALIRLSCGIEDADDLIADLDQAIG
ncbi:MAG: PLP-dependent transferase [Alphaproteobacteria bacterium]|nr:PLP-dependent transferase [Alphaproteobacteria bacterium]